MICGSLRKGHTQSEAARAGGIHPRTLSRWLEEGRRHKRGKFKRLVAAADEARSQLRAELDDIEYEIATDRSLPASIRLRAVHAIRSRVFAHEQRGGMTVVDVYHHHEHQHDVQVDATVTVEQEERPPVSLVSENELATLPDDALADMLEALQKARAALPGPAPDIIDSEEVA